MHVITMKVMPMIIGADTTRDGSYEALSMMAEGPVDAIKGRGATTAADKANETFIAFNDGFTDRRKFSRVDVTLPWLLLIKIAACDALYSLAGDRSSRTSMRVGPEVETAACTFIVIKLEGARKVKPKTASEVESKELIEVTIDPVNCAAGSAANAISNATKLGTPTPPSTL
jgi:hypothetical protein